MKVAIIGAGIAGLACAKRLTERGIEVAVFDKGRRPGGRLSTLRIDGQSWDFGAPFVRVSNPQFAAQVQVWEQAGVIARWPDGPDGAWVGVPGMSALVEAAAEHLPVRFGAQVLRLDRDGTGWSLAGPDLREGPFAGIVLAVPCEQAATLLSVHDLMMAQEAASVRSVPCWSVMAAFDQPLPGLPNVIGEQGPIRWAARNNSKPGRGSDECWVIHGESAWSQQKLEMPAPQVAHELLAALAGIAGIAGQDLPEPKFLKAHRWRFALPMGQRGKPLWNPALQLGACGDWCVGPRIEGAWRSGVELADQIAAGLTNPACQPTAVSVVGAS
jgi:renalase